MTTNSTPAVERLREGLTIAEMLAHDVPLSLAASEKLRLAWFALDEVAALAASPRQPTNASVREAALEAAAQAMCDRVNGVGDYAENVGQRRTGWRAQAQVGIDAYLAALSTPSVSVTQPSGGEG